MELFLVFAFVWFCVLAVIATWVKLSMRKAYKNQKTSQRILFSFEQDNQSPDLSDMIAYHKKNGVVEYQVD